MLNCEFLGSCDIRINDRSIINELPQKSVGLLIYFLMHLDKNIYRQNIATLFWDNYSQESAYRNLRYALWSIRKTINQYDKKEYFTSPNKNTLKIDKQNVKIDAMDFLNVTCNLEDASMEELEYASNLYKGSFLKDLYIKDVPLFDDWVLTETERLQKMYFNLNIRLAQKYEKINKTNLAINNLDKLITIDPLNETIYYQIIKLKYDMGNKADAINVYRKVKNILRQELNISPSKEIQDLYNKIILEEKPSNTTNNEPIEYKIDPKKIKSSGILNLCISKDPEELNNYYLRLNNMLNNDDIVALEICYLPGYRVNYEGIHEIVDNLINNLNKKNCSIDKAKINSIVNMNNIYEVNEYYIYNEILKLIIGVNNTVIMKIWSLHFLDSKTIDFISFLLRKFPENKLRIYGVYDLNWENKRLDQFIMTFRTDKETGAW